MCSAALQPAATNRVAQYLYFAIGHTTDDQSWQDEELIKLIPAYSNSQQRLSLMQYVAATATNTYERAYAQRAVQALLEVEAEQIEILTMKEDGS